MSKKKTKIEFLASRIFYHRLGESYNSNYLGGLGAGVSKIYDNVKASPVTHTLKDIVFARGFIPFHILINRELRREN